MSWISDGVSALIVRRKRKIGGQKDAEAKEGRSVDDEQDPMD